MRMTEKMTIVGRYRASNIDAVNGDGIALAGQRLVPTGILIVGIAEKQGDDGIGIHGLEASRKGFN
jgi:hypothetical protein